MVRAVDQLHLEINQRVAGNGSMSRGFDDALFNRGTILLRHRATKNLVFKNEALTARQRLKDALAIAKLPASSGLLLVTPLHLRSLSNSFLVGNFGRMQHHFNAVTLLEFLHHSFHVDLA